jgi:molecular chaperone GrpE
MMKQDKIREEAQNPEQAHDPKHRNTKPHGKAEKHNEAQKPEDQTGSGEETKKSELDEVKNKLNETESKLAEMHDKYLRLSAEFDNYRKRTLKERVDLLKTAGEESILKIIPVLDDFDRALKIIDSSKETEPMKEGIHLIYNKFKDALTQQGIKEIEALNQPFNTDLHDAVTKVPAPDGNSKGKVLEVVQKGYILNDKVIRFAKVIVGE